MTVDPALERAAQSLPDPARLTATQIRALRLVRSYRTVMTRGGWKANNRTISARTSGPLETMNLVRRVLERGRYHLVTTGAGSMLLDVIDARQARKGKPQ